MKVINNRRNKRHRDFYTPMYFPLLGDFPTQIFGNSDSFLPKLPVSLSFLTLDGPVGGEIRVNYY